MNTVTIHDAKSNLSKYIAAAKRGEKVYIGSFGKPEVQLVVLPKNTQKRVFGTGTHKFNPTHDAFSSKTDSEIASMMYGE